MMLRRVVTSVLGFALGIWAAFAAAQIEVPEPLEPWRDWVLYGEEYRACPVLGGSPPGRAESHICAWPERLVLDVAADAAAFSQAWTLYADAWVPLPGDGELWPSDVAVDGTPEAVVLRAGRPTVRLVAGRHTLAGRLTWTTRPAAIPVPNETGLVALRVDGTAIVNPTFEGGALWLGLRADDVVDEDRLSVVVYRLLTDSLPIRLRTRIELDIAGQSREVALPNALLTGFVGEALQSELPVRLDPDGSLRVQVRPGRWPLLLTAHLPDVVAELTVAAAEAPWPADEIWSFEAEPRLRVAALEGAAAVDSQRSGVPGEWQQFPSYQVAAGQTLTLAERSRNAADERNRLVLQRNLWLDFDGGGFTAQDFVQGEMRSGWRLDMAAPYTMTMASVNDLPLLITAGLAAETQGVELRESALTVVGTARLVRDARVPVTGYRDSFDRVDTTLHLPPARRLLAAPGADGARGAWFDSWRLLDIFLTLIVCAAAWRMFGVVPGLVALAAMVLMFHEPGAPRWAWLNLLVAIGLMRVAPEGRLRTFANRYRIASFVVLGLLLIPFTVGQLRVVIFPQLEQAGLQLGVSEQRPGSGLADLLSSVATSPQAGDRARVENFARSLPESGALEEITVTGSVIERDVTRYVPGALVQTGPGLPDWAWRRYSLSFSGPVEAEQTYRMIIAGPWLVGTWRVASVALALAFVWLLAGARLTLPPGLWRAGRSAAVALVAAMAWPDSGHAQALNEFPSPALLAELKQRLTEPAPCHPVCAELVRAAVTLTDNELLTELEFAVQDAVAVPVATAGDWLPQNIVADGAAVGMLYRGDDGRVWLRLAEGVHRVTVSGPIPPADSFALPFPLTPRRIVVTAPGWDVAGVTDGRLPSGTLELIRQRQDDAPPDQLPATIFPPYVQVVRHVEFDLDWRVRTQVRRIAPADSAFTLDIGLLPGEAVVTPGITAAGGMATVAFAAGQDVAAWESQLPTAAALTLTAPADAPWTETWRFTLGHIWHAEYDGLPVTPPEFFGTSFYVPEYFPRPGEILTIDLTRPNPASGDTIAIDSVNYSRNVGQRASQSNLEFTYRSTRGMDHALTLPEGAALEAVRIDGRVVPLQLDGRVLGIPATPGEHTVQVEWTDAAGIGARVNLPVVDLGVGASNLRAGLSLPADRWVLATSGPTLGPAVLYWAELAVFALAALLIGRLASSPLRTHEWLLLGLGLSTFAWPALGLFVVWAFAMSWREKSEKVLSRRWFNARQVVLGVLTVAALMALLGAIPVGLLGSPDMQIASPVFFGQLSWFEDRSAGATPDAAVLSLSLWFYKAAMLAWALWLSFALLRWLPWAWRAFGRNGIWRGRVESGA
jgi:hypothetical protein